MLDTAEKPAIRTPEERRAEILSLLDRTASVQVSQLAERFGVSRVTARADLDALARDGKLRRTHGGAISLSKTLTVSVQDKRVNVNAEAKRAIARTAAAFVQDGDSVLVDSGTTALEFVRALADHTRNAVPPRRAHHPFPYFQAGQVRRGILGEASCKTF